ncbi:PEP-CTERM sorting domain-containing protein [Paucibacter sp. APW11]|uniref:PEP-CTERM sorting domain-containing protein n=1 Tax=Roseateles aquae TaxID=3077235 RepID=A0ABU3P6S6_9BURK|nr:PEP-CTERM sorting domain-containing protein [Paucibacter sp. APW11]MDT8998264.1 PEP-CTERM sorting domain-containing protein [Paucibacter sp. APW11]
MKLKSTFLATLGLVASLAAHADTIDFGAYVLDFDASTVFGAPAYSFSSSGDVVGFAWQVPSSVQVVSIGGAAANANFNLPSFTVLAKPGFALSGGFSGFLGNLVFNEVGGSTSASASGQLSVDGGPAVSFGGTLGRTITTASPGFTSGFYAGSSSAPVGAFSSLSFSGGVLSLSASGGSFASVIGQPQNELKLSFVATPVPEPQTYALLLAGLGVVGALARRRREV